MRSIRTYDVSRVAKIEMKQERGATRKEQNAQYRNTWDFQDKVDGENLLDNKLILN